jgi:hypothetical protein
MHEKCKEEAKAAVTLVIADGSDHRASFRDRPAHAEIRKTVSTSTTKQDNRLRSSHVSKGNA